MPFASLIAAAPPSAPPDLSGREQLRALGMRRDGPALVHLVVQVGALLGFGVATARLAAAGHGAWLLAAGATGAVVLSFFPMLHEAGHGTAFATPFWNALCVWLGAVAMGQARGFFRESHWEHHRSTQDVIRDPEIASAPAPLDDWPSNPLVYLGLVSGQLLLLGKVGFTLACALLPRSFWTAQFPFIRREQQRRVAWESRATLAIWVAGVGPRPAGPARAGGPRTAAHEPRLSRLSRRSARPLPAPAQARMIREARREATSIGAPPRRDSSAFRVGC